MEEPLLKTLPNFKKFKSYINDVKNNLTPIMLSGLTDSGKVHFAYATKFYAEKPICIITYNEMQAKKIIKDLKLYEENVYYFPKREVLNFDYLAESKENIYNRIDCLNNIYNKNAKVIVTTIEAVEQPIIPKATLYKNILNLKVSDTYNLNELKEKLMYLGYERYDLVESKGQFSVRGGIVDIAVSEKIGIRVEFWGDEIDSIRTFDIRNQRSIDMLKNATIYPSCEFVLENGLDEVINNIIENKDKNKIEYLEEDIELIKSGDYISKVNKYFNDFYSKYEGIIDYLGEDYIVFLDEAGKIKARSENIEKDTNSTIQNLIEKQKYVPQALLTYGNYIEFIDSIRKKQVIYLEKQDIGFVDKQSMHAKRNGYSFSYREVNFFRSSMDLLLEELQEATKKTVIILAGNESNVETVVNLLNEKNINATTDPQKFVGNGALAVPQINDNSVLVLPGSISNGFECYDFNLMVITVEEIFSKQKPKRVTNTAFKQGETVVFADLKVGDYIVHKTSGIGQFIGVNTIKADGITKDYIKLRYKDDDILYVPTNSLDNVRKYIGSNDGAPKLNRLGSKEWETTKAKVKSNLREVARELIELYAKRQKSIGYAFSPDTPWQKQFEDNFPYTETADQLRCIEEVKKDMEQSKTMDRLLCGDVGYGKTEVAIRAAFKACMDQKQVAYLVPTTILANQQYESFKDRMKDFPIRVELLNRFRTKKQQEAIIKKLKLGEIDVIIGTHRLLSKDVEFKDLGLLIIDEEHRFGVKDKEKIKQLKTNVDVLTMTATPIPRTLHMSIVGIRDMSVIYEPPQNRIPVQTYVLEYDEEVIREAITKELERDGQVFYLYNNVENIDKKANEIAELVPEAKVGFAHGQMTGKELEEIMLDFIEKRINVIVCTTILESGIDIPNANTIIVENADRLGLAQLYQIRGRVGRSDKQAYAYVMYKRDKLLSEIADKRLRAIKEFTEFGSGFKIALRDLEIRGAGSLLGEYQHGHMEQVGYDMYCKLLDEVVKEITGEQVEVEIDVQIDINVSSYIPDEFIENGAQKIEVYQNIALCKTKEDILNVTDEIIDRFGKMPKEVENLLKISEIKQKCREKGISKLTQRNQSIVIEFVPELFDYTMVDKLIQKYKNRIKFSPAQRPYVTYKLQDTSKVIGELEEFLKML